MHAPVVQSNPQHLLQARDVPPGCWRGPSVQTRFCTWKEALESHKMAQWVQSSTTGLMRASQVPQVYRVTLWHVGAVRSSLPRGIYGEKLSFSSGAAAKLKFCKTTLAVLFCLGCLEEWETGEKVSVNWRTDSWVSSCRTQFMRTHNAPWWQGKSTTQVSMCQNF